MWLDWESIIPHKAAWHVCLGREWKNRDTTICSANSDEQSRQVGFRQAEEERDRETVREAEEDAEIETQRNRQCVCVGGGGGGIYPIQLQNIEQKKKNWTHAHHLIIILTEQTLITSELFSKNNLLFLHSRTCEWEQLWKRDWDYFSPVSFNYFFRCCPYFGMRTMLLSRKGWKSSLKGQTRKSQAWVVPHIWFTCQTNTASHDRTQRRLVILRSDTATFVCIVTHTHTTMPSSVTQDLTV